MKRFIKALAVILILSSITVFSIPKSRTDENVNEIAVPQKANNLILIIDNDVLVLLENDHILKFYDVNISVLPSEDILLLTNGINVNSVSEADEIAENFDG